MQWRVRAAVSTAIAGRTGMTPFRMASHDFARFAVRHGILGGTEHVGRSYVSGDAITLWVRDVGRERRRQAEAEGRVRDRLTSRRKPPDRPARAAAKSRCRLSRSRSGRHIEVRRVDDRDASRSPRPAVSLPRCALKSSPVRTPRTRRACRTWRGPKASWWRALPGAGRAQRLSRGRALGTRPDR